MVNFFINIEKISCAISFFVLKYLHWGISAVGSAFEWHSKGRGFESHMLHFKKTFGNTRNVDGHWISEGFQIHEYTAQMHYFV